MTASSGKTPVAEGGEKMSDRKDMDWSKVGPGTASVWAGEEDTFADGATQVPLVHSVAFGYPNLDEWSEVALGREEGHIYSRATNPTVRVFEDKVRMLEGAEAATSFSTGMAAISNSLFTLVEPGDRVVSIKDTYGGTSKVFLEMLPEHGVEIALCETEDYDEIERQVAQGCRLLYLETPTNPTLKVVDLGRLIASAHDVGAIAMVDNTFATPINQCPIEYAADLVVHSATKYLGGHADALGGVLCGRRDLVERVFRYREIAGASLHPTAAFLLIRGMKTLELRIARHNQSALQVAHFLEGHERVDGVFYPGLESHPSYEVARSQMKGFGGVLSFSLEGGIEAVSALLPRLRFAHMAANLGSVSTLAGPPSTTSHVELTVEQRQALGIPESLIRYSVGIENPEDLLADLEQALAGL
jgi:cystathionine gamma-synthase